RIPDPSRFQYAGHPRPDRRRPSAPAQRRLSRGLDCGGARPPAQNERLALADDILRVARDGPFLRTVEVPADSVEGYLFPDTYQFVKGMMPEEILARMVTRLRERISPEILAAARARDLSMHQLLTLASIIEKEAVERREMPLISAVFWNRLKLEMPLQA